jgi:hypothetical protein
VSAHTVVGCRAVPGGPLADVPSYVTSRDAAALLGVPEPEVRQLIRDGLVAGFRAGGYWIADGAAVARYGASAEGALARLRTDYPGWRIGPLTSGYFAIADGASPAGRAVVFSAATVDGLRRNLDGWHADRLAARRAILAIRSPIGRHRHLTCRAPAFAVHQNRGPSR